MSGFTNEVVNANNVDFSGGSPVSAKLVSNGQMLIASTALNAGGTHINAGTITSPDSSITVGYISPNITLQVSGSAITLTGDSGGALFPTAGNFNILTGANAGATVKITGSGSTLSLNLASAIDNITIGRVAGNGTMTGNQNVGVGSGVLQNLTSGTDNVGVGFAALNLLTSGTFNVALGRNALASVQTTNGNTAVGYQALNTATAQSNTAIGFQALPTLIAGIHNTALGYTSGSAYTGSEGSNIVIKHAGVAAESNTLRIGTNGVAEGQVSRCFIAGITGVAVASSAIASCDANGQIGTLAAGSAGQVLQSNGASSPSYSTATYPSTAGTSGNVLTSNGTNWSSTAPAVQMATITLTSAQIKALHATPIQIIASPGVGKVICVLTAIYCNFIYGGTNVFVAGAAQDVALWYGTSTKVSSTGLVFNATLTGTTSLISTGGIASNASIALASFENLAINAYNSVATEISGNAANNNTITMTFAYYIATI